GLAPPYDACHGCPSLPLQTRRRFAARRRFRETEQNESGKANRRLKAMALLLPSIPEIRRLLARSILRPPIATAFIMAWSLWRRMHQFKAACAHYRKRS